MVNTYCPILAIGFNPPEEGKRDMRLCHKNCAWYNVSHETCNINVIAEAAENTEVHTSDTMSILAEQTYGYFQDDYPEDF